MVAVHRSAQALLAALRAPGARPALAVGAVAALVAGAGLRPLTRRWPAAVLGSLLSSTATETPRATAVLLAVGGRRRRPRAGRCGPGGAGGARRDRRRAVGVLLDLDRRARADSEVLAEALRARDRPRGAPGAGRRRALRARAATGTRRPATSPTARTRWRTCSTCGATRCCPPTPGAPVLLQIHGGAWSSGSKAADAHPLMAHMVERGWVCVSVDYRLGPAERWPAQIVDVKRALAWTRTPHRRARRRPGPHRDHGRVVGRPPRRARRAHPGAWQPGFPDADTSVAAAVCLYGIYDLTSDDGSGTLDELLAETMMPDRAGRRRPPVRRRLPGGARAPRRPAVHGAARHRRRDRRPRAEPRVRQPAAGGVARRRWCTPSSPTPSTASTSLPTPRTLAAVRAIAAFLEAVVGRGTPRSGRADTVVAGAR